MENHSKLYLILLNFLNVIVFSYDRIKLKEKVIYYQNVSQNFYFPDIENNVFTFM